MLLGVKNFSLLLAIFSLLISSSTSFASFYGYKAKNVRIATFNAFLNRNSEGQLISDLSDPTNPQIRAVAEIIQRSRPDVILINEFDFDAAGEGLKLFQKNFLSVSQNGAKPIRYPFIFNQPSNTGVPSGQDFNNDGNSTGPNDAFGFGFFEGQFAMALLSKHPIVHKHVRTFQKFLWADMPGALLPEDPNDADGNGDLMNWFTEEELNTFRLSSKSHWDIPIRVNGKLIHILAAHPTPPVFDGIEDLNGRRNHDEIRFWVDYVTPGRGDYIYDDREGRDQASGGLKENSKFVIVGDYNADPLDGDSTLAAANQLLSNLQIQDPKPTSIGGLEDSILEGRANEGQRLEPLLDTADFNPAGPGNLRVDYVLPSSNINVRSYKRRLPCKECRGVFWPSTNDPLRYLVGNGFPVVSSDHHLIWADIVVFRKKY